MTIIMTKIGAMMKMVSVAEAKAQLSALLDAAEAGEHITITRHGRPVAKLEPVLQPKQPWESLAALRAQMPPWPKPSVEILREMRDEADERIERALADWRPRKSKR